MKVHPLADLIPAMSDEEYRGLRDDIEANGLREAITLYDGQILDGRHRHKACSELGIESETRVYEGDDPAAFVLSMNMHRRHLTVPQRADIARQALPHLEEEAKKRQGQAPGQPQGVKQVSSGPGSQTDLRARDQAGELVGVSGRTVSRMDYLAKEAPDLHKEALEGQTPIRAAEEEARRRANGDAPKEKSRPTPTATGTRVMSGNNADKAIAKAVASLDGIVLALQRFTPSDVDHPDVAEWAKAVNKSARFLLQFSKQLREVSA